MTPSQKHLEKAREIMRISLPIGELDNYKDSRKLLYGIAHALDQVREETLEEAAKKSEAFNLLSDCNCERANKIAQAIRSLWK